MVTFCDLHHGAYQILVRLCPGEPWVALARGLPRAKPSVKPVTRVMAAKPTAQKFARKKSFVGSAAKAPTRKPPTAGVHAIPKQYLIDNSQFA